jgi:superfamily II DNA or RNA helicase
MLAQRCRRSFSGNAWHAGEDYSRQHRVEIVGVDPQGLAADVVDRDGTHHDVKLDWSEIREQIIDASCTCERAAEGYLCKHVAAVVQSVDRTPAMPRLPGNDDIDVMAVDDAFYEPRSATPRGVLQQLSSQITVSPATQFAPPRGGQAVTHQQPAKWRLALKEFALAQQTPNSTRPERVAPTADKSRLFYRISLKEQSVGQGLKIEFVKRVLKRNGQLGVSNLWSLREQDIAAMADPADRELLALLLSSTALDATSRYYYYSRSSSGAACCELTEPGYTLFLPRMAATGRLVWVPGVNPRHEEPQPLAWDEGSPWKLKLTLSPPQDKSGRKLAPVLYRDGEEVDVADVCIGLTGLILFRDRLARLDHSVTPQTIAAARKLPQVYVPAGQEGQLVEEIWRMRGLPPIDLPDDLKWEQVRAEPRPIVKIAPVKIGSATSLIGKLAFDYAGLIVDSEDERQAYPADDERRIVHRDLTAELKAMKEIYRLGATPASYAERYYGRFKVGRKDFAPLVVALNEAGWQVEAEGHRLRRPGTTHVSLASGVDWFELDGHVDYEGEQIGLPKLLEALRRGDDFVALGDGSRGMLPAEWLARYAPLAAMGEAEGDKLRFKPSQALLLDAWLSAQPEVDIDAAFNRVRDRLRSFEGVQSHAEPRGFSGTLRPYQREGLGWLLFLEEFGFGGCLADDMGLGKTIQVLAMIVERRNRAQNGQPRRPTLVVVPRSLVQNWIEEARRFAPELKVLDYTGLARSDERAKLDQYDVVLTTYGTLRRDAGHLKDLPFDYAILDEAQAIKNAASQAAKACRLIQAEHRLAMTGTPVENHLGELWSIFEFLNPGMLGRTNSLKLLSSKTSTADAAGVQLLAKALRPFILRRTKEQVLTDLPEKMEQTLYCELDTQQRKLYDELRKHYRDALNKRIASDGINKAKIHVLEALLRLRQAACHPGLLDKSKASQPSAKLETLLEQLDEVLNEGHKALVFSQFTSLLGLVRQQLDKRKFVYEYLDGSTTDRQARVDRFQNDPDCPLFLISLKAGGLGLNLTAADYVFILDPWWNPAVEAQAVDRAHRIGQTRRVFAYRLIARDTVEEKILQLQGDKRKLADAIISADNSVVSQLTAEDLQMLLS